MNIRSCTVHCWSRWPESHGSHDKCCRCAITKPICSCRSDEHGTIGCGNLAGGRGGKCWYCAGHHAKEPA